MSGQNLPEIKAQLSDKQQRAAEMLVENEFMLRKDKLSYEELAEKLGVSVRTLFNWRNDPDFIQYQWAISQRRFASEKAMVDSQVISAIRGNSSNGIPSMKAVDIYYKYFNLLNSSTDITIHEGKRHRTRKTVEQVGESIDQLNALLDEE